MTTPVSPQPVPRWVQIVTVVAVSVVAAVAAIASYVHMHELATDAGEGWRAHLIPLSVDGMLVAASMVMLVRRRIGQSAGVLPWVGLVLGLVASLAANVAAADPTPLSWIVSGWPPLALAVSFELLILVTRDVEQAAQVPAAEAAPAPSPRVVADIINPPEPEREPAAVAEADEQMAEATPDHQPAEPMSYDDAVAWAVREDPPAGAKLIMKHCGLSEYKAKNAARDAKAARARALRIA